MPGPEPVPGAELRRVLDAQFALAWRLLDLHLDGLGDEELLWRPAPRGPHVERDGEVWRGRLPDTEEYAAGPPSIAWLTWHIGFWWSMALDHSFGAAELRLEDVTWPGSATATRAWLERLHEDWASAVAALPDPELFSTRRTRWPFSDRPFHELAGWLNLELMKNAAEIGYARFLYGTR